MGLVAMNERAADFGQVKLPGEGENNYDPLSSKLNLIGGGNQNNRNISLLFVCAQ